MKITCGKLARLSSLISCYMTAVFDKNFSTILATTPELKEQCYRLRKKIFCDDRSFPLDCRTDLETDHYDDHALHFLVQHKLSGAYVGTGRLILPNASKLLHSFPIQSYLPSAALKKFGLSHMDQIMQTCEISRVGFLPEYAKNSSALYQQFTHPLNWLVRKKIASIGKLGLYRCIMDYALNVTKTPNCVFTTDPPILKKFGYYGFTKYDVMGPDIDIFGPVTPVYFNIREAMARVKKTNMVGWSIVTDRGKILKPSKKNPVKLPQDNSAAIFTPMEEDAFNFQSYSLEDLKPLVLEY